MGSIDANITKYLTVITVVNTGTAPITVTGTFYNQNGTPSTLQMKTNVASVPTFTANLTATTLAANGVLVITADTATSGAVNWGKIVTTGAASVSSYFEFRDVASNYLYTRVGLAASSPTMKRFLIPWVRTVSGTPPRAVLDVGFALVNSGTAPANITVTAKNASGVTVGAPFVYSAAVNSHMADFAYHFLSLPETAGGPNYGFLLFESSSATISAAALAFEAGALSSFPIEILE